VSLHTKEKVVKVVEVAEEVEVVEVVKADGPRNRPKPSSCCHHVTKTILRGANR